MYVLTYATDVMRMLKGQSWGVLSNKVFKVRLLLCNCYPNLCVRFNDVKKKKKGKKADIMRLCLSSAVWDTRGNIPASQIKMTLAGPNFHFRNRWVACLRP